jgi:hypothetical protein
MELLLKILVVASLVGLIWFMIQPRFVFYVRIDAGQPRVTKGKVTAAFLDVIGETCQRNGVARGWVGGVAKGREIALEFSRSIPQPCRQQLRNMWMMHR